MTLAKFIQQLKVQQNLDAASMTSAMEALFSGHLSEGEARDFLVCLHQKGETQTEIAAAARFLKSQAVRVESIQTDLFDCCGTGGDGTQSFNVSTAAAFVLAGAGVHVAKHGNRAISSRAGSSDVLEALGINIHLGPLKTAACLEKTGIAFMFAPDFHPALAKIAPVRKSIPHRTIFNLLGPLLNPADVKKQLVGVFDSRWLIPLVETFREFGSTSVVAVSSVDGMDEVALDCNTNICRLYDNRITNDVFDPRVSGYQYCRKDDLAGGHAQDNAIRLVATLKGHSLPLDHVVHINAAWGLIAAGKASDFMDALLMAQESISSGRAFAKLESLRDFSQKSGG